MKLLSVKELSEKRESERLKDIERTRLVKEQLNSVTKSLEEAEAKFNLALANQHIRWKQAEEEAIKRIEDLNKEIKELELKKESILVPIEEREKKSYDLITEAEKTFNKALEKQKYNDEITVLLEEKLDSLHEFEINLEEREKTLQVKEKANEEQRLIIKNLSDSLSNKLSKL